MTTHKEALSLNARLAGVQTCPLCVLRRTTGTTGATATTNLRRASDAQGS